jgi:thymidine kinase
MAKLYFYYSAMNAGKTTTLLQSAYNYAERGMRTLIMTPQLDTRAQTQSGVDDAFGQARQRDAARPTSAGAERGIVASRIGLRAGALRFARTDDLLAVVRADIAEHGKLDCVLVDEAQFLGRAQAWQLGDVVDVLEIPVLAYGLRTDFRGELFEGSQYLLAWADNLVEIKTICHTGRKATMVVRVDAHGHAVTDGPQVEIGGNERYVSVSRAEFKKIMSGEGRVELQQGVLPLAAPGAPTP